MKEVENTKNPEEVEVIIRMPKKMYEDCKVRNTEHYSWYDFSSKVANGVLLPEGHGKIVDVNELDITTIITDDFSGNEMLDVVLKEDIDNAHDLLSTIGTDKDKGLEEPEEDMEKE